jgi:hypothetical protein
VRRKDRHRRKFSVSVQAFKESLTAVAGEKESFFDAAILIFSPFAGLRPSRSGERLDLEFSESGQRYLAVACRPADDAFRTLSRIAWACAFVMSCASAGIVTSSDEFISKFLENRGKTAISHSAPSES